MNILQAYRYSQIEEGRTFTFVIIAGLVIACDLEVDFSTLIKNKNYREGVFYKSREEANRYNKKEVK